MISEEEFQINQEPINIFDSLLKSKDSCINLDQDISITYSESNNPELSSKIKNFLIQNESQLNQNFDLNLYLNEGKEDDSNNENNDNNLFSINYKDIYIGGISANFKMREGFGLNKYENENIFYVGQWKNNMKEGIGFLKINDDTFYAGYFLKNQFDGNGILYVKSKNLLYIGHMNNGAFDEGVYIDIDKEVYYRGKFILGKKNDKNCTLIEMKNKQLFIGSVENDEFKKGYLCLYNSKEIQNKDENEEINFDFSIEKIFYYYKDDNNDIKFVYNFDNEFKEILNKNMKKIFSLELFTQSQIENIIQYFSYLETLEEDDDYNNIIKYNEKDDKSLCFMFFSNYNYYIGNYQEEKEKYDINEIKNEIDISQDIINDK